MSAWPSVSAPTTDHRVVDSSSAEGEFRQNLNGERERERERPSLSLSRSLSLSLS